MSLSDLKRKVKKISNPAQAKNLQRFFKTGKGLYGEGDIFAGIMVPQSRKLAQEFSNLPFSDLDQLIKSKIHEERLIALLILVHNFEKTEYKGRKKIFDFYLKNTKYINNWDLVDLSAPRVVGNYLLNKPRAVLYKLVKSKNLWERRIAVLATFMFIKNNQFKDSLEISKILLSDSHDLIHKAVGWMLREVGKKSLNVELKFLNKYSKKMPRTTLRYAIERFPENLRKKYLN